MNISELYDTYNFITSDQKKRKEYNAKRWSHKLDYSIFYTLAKSYKVCNVFECGTNAGLSAMAFAIALEESSSFGKVYTWDIREIKHLFDEFPIKDRIVFNCGPFANDAEQIVSEHYKGTKNLYFIDGNHSEEGCTQDFDLVSKYSSSGDVILFHDYNKAGGVRAVFDNINREKFILNTPTGIGVVVW